MMRAPTLARFTALLMALPLLAGSSGREAQAQGPHVVVQIDRQYAPLTLTVKAGDAVLFRNDDVIPHHIVSHTPIFPFDLDLQDPGAENKIVFDKPGQVVVGCDIHPRMEMVVTVTE